MPFLSTLRGPANVGLRTALVSASKPKTSVGNAIQVRYGGARTMQKVPSRYSWLRMLDNFHYYITLTAVPLGIFIAYMQIRIGPAKLKEIPEGYVPKEYEYYKDPIQRFMQKYNPFLVSYAADYERSLFYLNYHDERRKERLLTKKVYELNKARGDVQGWYFIPDDTSQQTDTIEQLKQANQ